MQIQLSDNNLNAQKAFNILGYFFNQFVGDRDIDDSWYATKKVNGRLFEMHYEVHAQGNYYLTAVNDFLWAMSKIKNRQQIFK